MTGGTEISFTIGQLAGIIGILATLAPGLIYVGRLTARVATIEQWVRNHALEMQTKTDMLIRNDEILRGIVESQKQMVAEVASIRREISVLRSPG